MNQNATTIRLSSWHFRGLPCIFLPVISALHFTHFFSSRFTWFGWDATIMPSDTIEASSKIGKLWSCGNGGFDEVFSLSV